jgi:flagellar hook-associated protein 3 FlgL
MDRVVTMVQQNSLLQALMRTQSDMAKVQEQITTGKVGDQFQDLAPDVGVLLAAKRAEARTEGFETAAKDLARRLEMQDLHLNTLAAQAQGLRETLTDAVANNSGLSFMERLDGVFRQAVSILNSRLDGRYLYGGAQRCRCVRKQ